MKYNLNREEKTLLFLVRTINSCVKKGYLPITIWKNGNIYDIGKSKDVDRILKDFEPTEEEWLSCMKGFAEEYLDTSVAPKIPFC